MKDNLWVLKPENRIKVGVDRVDLMAELKFGHPHWQLPNCNLFPVYGRALLVLLFSSAAIASGLSKSIAGLHYGIPILLELLCPRRRLILDAFNLRGAARLDAVNLALELGSE